MFGEWMAEMNRSDFCPQEATNLRTDQDHRHVTECYQDGKHTGFSEARSKLEGLSVVWISNNRKFLGGH